MEQDYSFTGEITKDKQALKQIFSHCDDILQREMTLGRNQGISCFLIYIEITMSSVMFETTAIGQFLNRLSSMPEEEIYKKLEENGEGLSDFVPFKNLFNEWFAKDTSRKVKAAFKAKFATGQRIGAYAPIGYRKHPEIKNKLIIDEETRWIVEKIFDLAFHGRGAASITSILIAEKVPTPGFINFQRDGTFANIYAGAPEEKSYAWTIAQVKSIMKDETYIGHTIHYRETNISFKNKRRVRKPQSEWVRVENTQEPIISEQVFRQVQEQIANRRRKCKDGTTQIFSGLVKCADCGWSLSYGENRQNSKPYGHYHCSKYGQGTRQCSMHYIRYDVLYAYVLSRLQYWSVLAQQDGDKLLKRLLNASDKERNTARKRQTGRRTEKGREAEIRS